MNDIERIRASLHHALANGHPQEEILDISRSLDTMIVAGMRSRLDSAHAPAQSWHGTTRTATTG